MNTEKKNHKWGYLDTEFKVNPKNNSVYLTGDKYLICGYEMPHLLNFLEDACELEINFNDFQKEKKQYKIRDYINNETFIKSINNIEISFEDTVRLIHSHGQTSSNELYTILYKDSNLEREVDVVLFPKNSDEVERIINRAVENDVCLVPYGGGTNVSCALLCRKDEKRMIASVDMRNLNKLISIDKENNIATFGAGITGKKLEEILSEHNYTSGHEPDSYEFSTLGGWISTNASGMKRAKYGNIEDIVVNYKLITPKGLITKNIETPRNSHGSMTDSLVFGSEGNFGVITEASIKIHKKPETVEYQSAVFNDFKTGVNFLKDLTINYPDLIPASIRLIDNDQFKFAQALKPEKNLLGNISEYIKDLALEYYYNLDKNTMTVCTITYEGDSNSIKNKIKVLKEIVSEYGGILGGSENGKKGYNLTFAIAYIRDLLSQYYVMGETFETSVPWTNIVDVVESVKHKLIEETSDLEGKPFLSYRISQTYRTGVCIYFTLGIYHKGIDNFDDRYSEIEHELRRSIIEAGGSISHHHGIGKHRSDFLIKNLQKTEQNCLKSIKNELDPNNIFGIKNGVFNI